jgi:hypothetical protein
MLERVKLNKARHFVVPLITLSECATVDTTLNQPHNSTESTGGSGCGPSARDPLGITNYVKKWALLRSDQIMYLYFVDY